MAPCWTFFWRWRREVTRSRYTHTHTHTLLKTVAQSRKEIQVHTHTHSHTHPAEDRCPVSQRDPGTHTHPAALHAAVTWNHITTPPLRCIIISCIIVSI